MTTLAPVDRASLIATRRDIHQHPELGFEETRTAGLVAERLRGLDYQVTPGIGKTGVVALKKKAGGRCVLLRADMDALPVEEANAVPYRSKHPGKMHACGHDGHVAIGLEVARRLAPLELPGSVKFAFQPAEEASNGAQAMIGDGVLETPEVHAAFGIHLWNDLPVGTIGIMPGPVMASVDQFEIEILGRGGHAAAPHQTIDPVLIAAHVITGLQSLVSRRRDPMDEVVVSVTEVHAGRAFNVIPARADLRGTVRTFGGKFWQDAPRLVEETAQGIASAFGAQANVDYRRLSAPLVNDAKLSALMSDAARAVVGAGNVRTGVRTMGGEDMAYFLERVPGCFAFVGSAPRGGTASPHHSPT
ncbi:MAG: M20 metallopeptidase family protein, partial [Gemmatimonadales bacterium]